jgi:hypothetical protein
VACLLLMEVSNPSMHLNQLLKELGAANSTLSVANQVRGRCTHSAMSACMTRWHIVLVTADAVCSPLLRVSTVRGAAGCVRYGVIQHNTTRRQGWRRGHPSCVARLVQKGALWAHSMCTIRADFC